MQASVTNYIKHRSTSGNAVYDSEMRLMSTRTATSDNSERYVNWALLYLGMFGATLVR